MGRQDTHQFGRFSHSALITLPSDFSAKLPEDMTVVMNCPIETCCCICFPALCHAPERKHNAFTVSSVSSEKYCFGKFPWGRVIATHGRLAPNHWHLLFLFLFFYFRQLTDKEYCCSAHVYNAQHLSILIFAKFDSKGIAAFKQLAAGTSKFSREN